MNLNNHILGAELNTQDFVVDEVSNTFKVSTAPTSSVGQALAGLGGGGGGSSSIEFTASGAIAAGDVVAVNVDGTTSTSKTPYGPVNHISDATNEIEASTSAAVGIPGADSVLVLSHGAPAGLAILFSFPPPTHKMVVATRQPSGELRYGPTVPFGEGGAIGNTTQQLSSAVAFDTSSSTPRFLLASTKVDGQNDFNSVTMLEVGTITGSTPTIDGTISHGGVGGLAYPSVLYSTTQNRFYVIGRAIDVFNPNGAQSIGYSVVDASGSTQVDVVSTNSISGTSAFRVASAINNSTNVVLMVYVEATTGDLMGQCGTVTSSGITLGTNAVLVSGVGTNAQNVTCTFNEFSGNFVVGYGGRRAVVVTTDGGTSLSAGTPTVWGTNDLDSAGAVSSIVFVPGTGNVAIAYRAPTTNQLMFARGTVAGTTITVTPISTAWGEATRYPALGLLPTSGNLALLWSTNPSKFLTPNRLAGRTVDPLITIDTHTNIVGVASAVAADEDTVPVAVVGQVVDGLTGLTPGAQYYAEPSGGISTNQSPYPVGRALSSTSLLVTATIAPPLSAQAALPRIT